MKIILSLIAASVLFLTAISVNAQQVCIPRDRAIVELKNQFKENASARGLAANGKRMIELFVSEKGSWTMLISDPNGLSCFMANGENWQSITALIGDPA